MDHSPGTSVLTGRHEQRIPYEEHIDCRDAAASQGMPRIASNTEARKRG
jgi:hypothetical protein